MIVTLLAALTSFALKIVPFLSPKCRPQASGILIQAVEYAVCFIMGNIIVNTAFEHQSLTELWYHFDLKDGVVLATLAIAYVVCKLTRSILKSLVASIAFLGATTFFL